MFSAKEHLSQALGRNTTETCNTYNMLKLTRHLFCWEPNADYADYSERALLNHILASQNPETGMMCYYVPLRSGSYREFNSPNDSFWCCTGTGVENHAKYGDSIYFHDDRNLYVNLFIASELDWKAEGLKLRQETTYPEGAATVLGFTCEKPVELALHVRHPYWATAGFEVQVNGRTQSATERGSYALIQRTWKTGDRIEVKMPFSLRTEGFRDNTNRFALMYGPLVLCASVDARKPFLAVVADEASMLASLRPVAGKANTFTGPSNVFRVPGEADGQTVTLAPFYQAFNEHYVTYWDRFTPEEWAVKQQEFKKELAAQRELEARTVDYVQAGEEQGEQTDTREFNDRTWRVANTNGWFSWDLKVVRDRALEMRVEFSGSRNGNGLVLSVDDAKLSAEPSESPTSERGPRTSVYALSADLLKNKDKVTVKFHAPNDARLGSVASVRILKPQAEK
jgi:hypothetical protein